MAVQQGKSSFTQQMQGQLATFHEQMKGDDSLLGGGGDVPPNIENGVAQLSDIKVDIYKSGEFKGKWYFYAAGVCHLPKEVDGLPCEGLRTTIGPEPLCDTPKRTGEKARKTAKDHYEWMLKALRTLGVNTKNIQFGQIESVLAALKKSKPFFMFRTWRGKPTKEFPNPRTNHTWVCPLPAFDPNASVGEEGVVDNSDGVSDGEERHEEPQQAPPTKPAGKPAGKSVTKPAAPAKKQAALPPPEPEPSDLAEQDVETLVTSANEGDADAQQELERRAMELGWSSEAFAAATSWEESGQMATEAPPEEGGGEDTPAASEEEEAWMPEVDTVFKYIPPVKGPGGKLVKGKKEVECLVIAVAAPTQSCTLKSNVDGKTIYKDVPVEELIGFE